MVTLTVDRNGFDTQDGVYDITVNRQFPRGVGDSPSYEAMQRKFELKPSQGKVVDGELLYLKSENTHFLLVPKLLSMKDKPEERIISVDIFVFDEPVARVIQVAEIDLSLHVQQWNGIRAVHLGVFVGNRHVILLVADSKKFVLLVTDENSLRFKVLGIFEYKQAVGRITQAREYLHLLVENTLVVYRARLDIIAELIKRFDSSEPKSPLSNLPNLIEEVQSIDLTKYGLSASTTMKCFSSKTETLILLGKKDLLLAYLSITDYTDEDANRVVNSPFHLVAKGSFEANKLIDFSVRQGKGFNSSEGGPSSSTIDVVAQASNGQLAKYSYSYCPPNYLRMQQESSVYCKAVESISQFSIGFLSNEVKDCFSPGDDQHEVYKVNFCSGLKSEVWKQGLNADLVLENGGKLSCRDGQSTFCFDQLDTKKVDCNVYRDCFDCSLDKECMWVTERDNSRCSPISFGTIPDAQRSLTQYKKQVTETGMVYLNFASLKVLDACPRRKVLNADAIISDKSFNLTLGIENIGEQRVVSTVSNSLGDSPTRTTSRDEKKRRPILCGYRHSRASKSRKTGRLLRSFSGTGQTRT